MKFSLSLKYNAVPEWQDHYLSYSHLKKIVYELQTENLAKEDEGNGSSSSSSDSAKLGRLHQVIYEKLSETKNSLRKNASKLNFRQTTNEITDLEAGAFDKTESTTENEKYIKQFDPSNIFLEKLRNELTKIDAFYNSTEHKLYAKYDKLIADAEAGRINLVDRNNTLDETKSILSADEVIIRNTRQNSINANFKNDPLSSDLEKNPTTGDEDEDFNDEHSSNTALLGPSEVNLKVQKNITLKKRTTQLFVDLSQLKSYIELNRIGFSKIAKKFDKALQTELRATLFENNEFLKDAHTFKPDTICRLDAKLDNLVEVYASLTGKLNNIDFCKQELKSLLREHIVWERNTVWKDMIGIESKANGAAFGVGNDASAIGEQKLYQLDFYSWKMPFSINLGFTKLTHFKLPKFLNTSRTYKLLIIAAITAVLLGVKTFNDGAQHRCMALLACVALLWATEAIPLFVTALLCPLFVVLFKVVKNDEGKVMTAAKASEYVFSKMWSSTIMVLIGGFTLAAALSKYNIAKVLASYILSVAGTKPRNVLLAIMAVACFLSMWISNVAAPVLCYSLIQGVLRTQTTDAPFAKALILGVALASNVAGMASPISSPQNIVAMTYLSPYGIGWGQWLAVSIPVSVVSLGLIWMLLIYTFDVHTAKVMQYKPIKENFTIKQWYICLVTFATIILWCVLTQTESTFGESGQIAIIPIVLFFGTGLLSTADVNNFPWSIVLLAMGSLALGKAVSSSGLLTTIAEALQEKVADFSTYTVMVIFGALILVIGTFVSHTVSAIIIIPLVQEVGKSLPGDNAAVILIFAIALVASCGMGLASSGFPNVTAISMTDELGVRYLSVNNFISRGVPASIIAYAVVVTLGYGVMVTVA